MSKFSISQDQYINLLANQVSFFHYLQSMGDDVPDELVKNYEHTRYELIMQYNPVFVKMRRADCEYFGCIEFESIDDLMMMQRIAGGLENFEGNRVQGQIIQVDLFDEYFSEWFNLNYAEHSIFTHISDFNPATIKDKKFAASTYQHALHYFFL